MVQAHAAETHGSTMEPINVMKRRKQEIRSHIDYVSIRKAGRLINVSKRKAGRPINVSKRKAERPINVVSVG